jgi:hypothetical protein
LSPTAGDASGGYKCTCGERASVDKQAMLCS